MADESRRDESRRIPSTYHVIRKSQVYVLRTTVYRVCAHVHDATKGPGCPGWEFHLQGSLAFN